MDRAPDASIAGAFAAYRTLPQRRLRPEDFLGAPVVIYGTGSAGRDARHALEAHGSQVIGFLDHRAREAALLDGLPVWSPSGNAAWPREAIAVIGIFNPFVDVESIRVQLQSSGFGRVHTFLDLHDAFCADLGDRYWLTHRDRYLDWEPAVESLEHTWADEESLHVYAALLRFRLSHDYRDLPARSRGAQYFPGLPARSQRPLRLIDCGAFDGDTLEEVSRLGGSEAIAAFEPDLQTIGSWRRAVAACPISAR